MDIAKGDVWALLCQGAKLVFICWLDQANGENDYSYDINIRVMICRAFSCYQVNHNNDVHLDLRFESAV